MRQQAPAQGVGIISLLSFLFFVFTLVVSPGVLPVWASIMMALISLIGLAVSIGLWLLKNWARWVMFIFAIFSIFWLVSYIATTVEQGVKIGLDILAIPVVGLAWNGLIIWYFLRPSVKAQFQKSA